MVFDWDHLEMEQEEMKDVTHSGVNMMVEGVDNLEEVQLLDDMLEVVLN